jgi:hypothetical protein
MNARWLLGVLGCVACGDSIQREEVITASSGSRIALQLYRYDDGTEQPESNEFYDKDQRTLCTAQQYIDGILRCVPTADEAVYIDPTCTRLLGRAQTNGNPTHFIAHDAQNGLPARVFQAGELTTPITQYYAKGDTMCFGPFTSPNDLAYFRLGAEINASSLASLHDDELGTARIGLMIRETDDGLRVPLGLRDRDLGIDCTPALQVDGRIRCEPTEAVPVKSFLDPACREPVLVVEDGFPIPKLATMVEPSGCTSYYPVGVEVSPPIYRLQGDTCSQIPTFGRHVFSVGAAIETPVLGRTVEAVAGRRLQHIVLDDGDLTFMDQHLFDTATRADCERYKFSDMTRCIPANLAVTNTLFTTACSMPVAVAELPQRTCNRPVFAGSPSADGIDIRAIGDRAAATLFQIDTGTCLPYVIPPDTDLRTLGPPLDPKTFVGSIYFGER